MIRWFAFLAVLMATSSTFAAETETANLKLFVERTVGGEKTVFSKVAPVVVDVNRPQTIDLSKNISVTVRLEKWHSRGKGPSVVGYTVYPRVTLSGETTVLRQVGENDDEVFFLDAIGEDQVRFWFTLADGDPARQIPLPASRIPTSKLFSSSFAEGLSGSLDAASAASSSVIKR